MLSNTQQKALKRYMRTLTATAEDADKDYKRLPDDALGVFLETLNKLDVSLTTAFTVLDDFTCPFIESEVVDCDDYPSCRGCPIREGCDTWCLTKHVLYKIYDIITAYRGCILEEQEKRLVLRVILDEAHALDEKKP